MGMYHSVQHLWGVYIHDSIVNRYYSLQHQVNSLSSATASRKLVITTIIHNSIARSHSTQESHVESLPNQMGVTVCCSITGSQYLFTTASQRVAAFVSSIQFIWNSENFEFSRGAHRLAKMDGRVAAKQTRTYCSVVLSCRLALFSHIMLWRCTHTNLLSESFKVLKMWVCRQSLAWSFPI